MNRVPQAPDSVADTVWFEVIRWRGKQATALPYAVCRSISVILSSTAFAGLLTGCSHAPPFQIVASDIPYSKQLQMQEGDAYGFPVQHH